MQHLRVGPKFVVAQALEPMALEPLLAEVLCSQAVCVLPAQEAYAGRVRKDIDHEALKPAAWRIDALQVGTPDDATVGAAAVGPWTIWNERLRARTCIQH